MLKQSIKDMKIMAVYVCMYVCMYVYMVCFVAPEALHFGFVTV